MAEMTVRRVDLDGVRIAYADGLRSGPPLVLLHGGSSRWQAFETLLPLLTERWHVLAPDLRGHGESGWTPGRYALSDYARDLDLFLTSVVEEDAFVYGHSLGGMVGLMAAAHGTRMRGLAVGDSPLDRESWQGVIEASREQLLAWRDLAGGRLAGTELEEALRSAPVTAQDGRRGPMSEFYAADDPVFAWLAEGLARHDPSMLDLLISDFDVAAAGYESEAALSALECPLLLLQGDPARGAVMSDAGVGRAKAAYPRLSHVRLDGIGHGLHIEAPERVTAELAAFFGGL